MPGSEGVVAALGTIGGGADPLRNAGIAPDQTPTAGRHHWSGHHLCKIHEIYRLTICTVALYITIL